MSSAPVPAAAASVRRTRLVDVAEATGLDVSTVSRVLNSDPRQSVRAETRDRVLTAARRLGYRPNALARALKQSRSGALGLVVPMVRNPIWSVVERGALDRAAERGFAVLVVSEPPDRPRPAAAYQPMVLESRVDGLVLATTLRPGSHPGGDMAGDNAGVVAVPHVYLNRRGPSPGHDVVMDEEGAVRLWLQEMRRQGRRDLVLLDGPVEVDTVYRRALAARLHDRADRDVRVRVVHAPATEAGGCSAAARLFAGPRCPDGIGIGSLPQVVGLVAALRAAAICVPADLGLVSFDEDASLPYLGVPVTSVAMPLAALGAAGVDALLDQVAGRASRDVLVAGPLQLVRHDVAPLPGPAGPTRTQRATMGR